MTSRTNCFHYLLYAVIVFFSTKALGEEVEECSNNVCKVTYPATFFTQYAPLTALDMVDNLPGFSIDEGSEETRGFGATAGNILINGKRLSSKSESASDQLAIISVNDVVAIELLRGQLSQYNLSGQTVAANIIRKTQGASGNIEFATRLHQPASTWRPLLEVSHASTIGQVEYKANLVLADYQNINESVEWVYRGEDQTFSERREEVFDETGDFISGVLNSKFVVNNWEVNNNLSFEYIDEAGGEKSIRTPVGMETFTLFQPDTDEIRFYEIALDASKQIRPTLSIKVIGLINEQDYTETGGLIRNTASGLSTTESDFRFDSVQTERILRSESNYSGIEEHAIVIAAELAINELSSDFSLRSINNGQLEVVEVPGAQTQVEETRYDLRIADTFTKNKFSFETVIGAEYSRLKQINSNTPERSLFFLKPSLTVTYPLATREQVQLSLGREVGQLDFFDFTSSTDLGDGELSLGNTELKPESTTTFELSYEKRSQGINAFNMRFFYDWIKDVQDIIPLQNGLEVPGNIDSAKCYGFVSEITYDLDPLGIKGARLDTRLLWRDSEVNALDAQAYFAHPYSSWERGLNENFNGLLRQYFHKGMDLSHVTEKEVKAVQERLNLRPRACLEYRQPKVVFEELRQAA